MCHSYECHERLDTIILILLKYHIKQNIKVIELSEDLSLQITNPYEVTPVTSSDRVIDREGQMNSQGGQGLKGWEIGGAGFIINDWETDEDGRAPIIPTFACASWLLVFTSWNNTSPLLFTWLQNCKLK